MQTPVYLDNNSTTPVDPRVLSAMQPLFETQFGNPASTTHRHGWYVEELVSLAREQVAELLNSKPEEIIFTSGATESNNLALFGICRALLKHNTDKPPRVISASTEHRAVLDPLDKLREEGVQVEILSPGRTGRIDPDSLEKALEQKADLVSLMLGNNEIGVINNIPALSAVCKQHDVLLHCDATQAVGKIAVDVSALGVDLLSLSGHKVYGPKGIGALFVRGGPSGLPIEPIIYGGGHERGLRSGTLNSPAIVGFGKACEVAAGELERDSKRLGLLASKLLGLLRDSLSGIHLNGDEECRLPGNLNLRIDDVSNAALLGKLSTHLSLSATSACSSGHGKGSHVLKALGLSTSEQNTSIRIGIGRFNTEEEIAFAANKISQTVKELRQS